MNKPEKITEQEDQARLLFIGKCVDGNLLVPALNKFGVAQALTVQDICNSSIKSLKTLGTALEKSRAGIEGSRFSQVSEPTIGGAKYKDWEDFVFYTIKKKEYDLWKEKISEEVKALNQQIDAAKTPEEQRREAEARKRELELELS